MANRHPLQCCVNFLGGSRHGQTVEGAEAYNYYLATDEATIGKQIKDLTLACKELIRVLGFVAVHAASQIEREVYVIVDRIENPSTVAFTCRFSHVESQ